MATTGGFVRTKKNGTLTFEDGSGGANDTITVTFESGDLTADLKAADYQPVRARGVVQQFIEGDDPIYNGSFSCHVTAFLGGAVSTFDDLTQFMAAFGANDANITTTGLAGEPKTLTVILTIADPDGSGSETITWGKCVFPTIQITEGYPSTHTMTWMGRVKPVIA